MKAIRTRSASNTNLRPLLTVPEESLRAGERQHVQRLRRVIGDQYEVMFTSAEDHLCAMFASVDSMSELDVSPPLQNAVRELRELLWSDEFYAALVQVPSVADHFDPDTRNNLTADQLAILLQMWGIRYGFNLQLN